MKFDLPLLKLPRQYCAETLAAEVSALPQDAWIAHPGRLSGNDAVPLITPGGVITNGFTGPMAPTVHLRNCPYIMEIMADLGAVWGRSRLMGLAPAAIVPEHVDVGYYWRTHLRLHIPVITNPGVEFTCDDRTVHMAAGECWAFDSFCLHNVRNLGSEKRVHLVLDTVGSARLWDMMLEAQGTDKVVFVAPGTTPVDRLAFETLNTPDIMSAWEVRCHIDFLLGKTPPSPQLDDVKAVLDRFAVAWSAAWAQFGAADTGIADYQNLISGVRQDLIRHSADRILLDNKVPLDRALNELIFMVAVPALPVRATAGRDRQAVTA